MRSGLATAVGAPAQAVFVANKAVPISIPKSVPISVPMMASKVTPVVTPVVMLPPPPPPPPPSPPRLVSPASVQLTSRLAFVVNLQCLATAGALLTHCGHAPHCSSCCAALQPVSVILKGVPATASASAVGTWCCTLSSAACSSSPKRCLSHAAVAQAAAQATATATSSAQVVAVSGRAQANVAVCLVAAR